MPITTAPCICCVSSLIATCTGAGNSAGAWRMPCTASEPPLPPQDHHTNDKPMSESATEESPPLYFPSTKRPHLGKLLRQMVSMVNPFGGKQHRPMNQTHKCSSPNYFWGHFALCLVSTWAGRTWKGRILCTPTPFRDIFGSVFEIDTAGEIRTLPAAPGTRERNTSTELSLRTDD